MMLSLFTLTVVIQVQPRCLLTCKYLHPAFHVPLSWLFKSPFHSWFSVWPINILAIVIILLLDQSAQHQLCLCQSHKVDQHKRSVVFVCVCLYVGGWMDGCWISPPLSSLLFAPNWGNHISLTCANMLAHCCSSLLAPPYQWQTPLFLSSGFRLKLPKTPCLL